MNKLLYLLLFCSPLMGMDLDIQKIQPKIAKPSRIIKARARLQTDYYKPVKWQQKSSIKKQIIEISEWVMIEKDTSQQ